MSQDSSIYIPEQHNLASLNLEKLTYLKKNIIDVEKVICVRLRDIFDSWRPKSAVMLRMDVEGHERKILQTVPDEIEIISFELHAGHPYSREDAIQLLKKLKDHGFEITKAIYELHPFYLSIARLYGFKQATQIYVKREKIAPRYKELILQNPDLNTIYNMFTERKRFIHLLLER